MDIRPTSPLLEKILPFKNHMKTCSTLHFCTDQRKLYRPKLQRGLHLWDLSSVMLRSQLQIHLYINLLIPRFKRKTLCKEYCSFTILFPSQRFFLRYLKSPFHGWGRKEVRWWRERADTRQPVVGTPGAGIAGCWQFTCYLAIRHTAWICYISINITC